MTVRKYSSRSQKTSLSGAINSAATTANVVSGTSLMGGVTLSAGQTYTVVIDPDTALEEIVDVTAVSTNTLTIVRGIDGSSAVAHSAGAEVRHMSIGRDFREANDHIENTTTAHGLTIANVLETTDTNMITTAMLQASSVTTAKIADANVTTAKIADSAVTSAKIADLTIATGDIADSAITSGKIATGAVGTTKIDDLSVTEGKLAPSAVTAGKIATDAVTTTKILDANVTTAKIADSAITSAKIADGTIVAGDIADGAITSAKILDGTIVAGNLADGAVTSAKILDGTIVNADINASAAISYSKLNLAGTITSADIVNGTIVAADIADGTITAAKLVSDPYARANHTGSQTASTISDFDTQVRTSRLDQMAAPTGSLSVNSQKITNLATPTSNTDASTKAYVDTSIANLINGAPATLDTLDEIAQALNDTANFSDTVVLKSGSTMTGALTLSGAPSSNLHAATKAYVDSFAANASADAAAAAASAAAAAASYDSFDDRYLGAKASAPALDNDGNALTAGALYFNTTTGIMQVYDAVATAFENITSAVTFSRWTKTAAGGETTLNGADDNAVSLSYTAGYEQVYLNGVLLTRGSDYTASNGSSITGITALTAGDIVEVLSATPYSVANALTTTVVDAKGDLLVGTASDTVGRLAVGSANQYLQVDSSTATGLKWSTLSAVTTLDLTINAQTGTTYTLVSDDANKLVTLTNAGGITLTLPPSIFTAGQQIHIARMGAGSLTLAQGAGVTIVSTGATTSAPTLRAQYSTGTIICTASNTFLVIGDIA